MRFEGTDTYIATPDLMLAVNAAIALERIADSRILIDQARLLVLNAAYMMDTVGNKNARAEIGMIKVAAPNMACQVIDWAIQAHGGGGVSQDFPLAYSYAMARTLRIADGPDEVHKMTIARREIMKHAPDFRMNPTPGTGSSSDPQVMARP